MGQHTIERITFDSALVCGVLFAPWWLVVLGALLGSLLFEAFAESLVIGALYDSLYGGSMAGWHGFYGTIVGFLVFLVAYFARSTIALVRRD